MDVAFCLFESFYGRRVCTTLSHTLENDELHPSVFFSEIEEDDIKEHESYFINTSLKPCSYETSPDSIGVSSIATLEIFNPLTLSVYKNFKRVVVDAYVYHKFFRSRSALKLVLEGKPLQQISS